LNTAHFNSNQLNYNIVRLEKAYEPFYDFLSFFPVGVVSFREKAENQGGKGDLDR
jgi:hypothetical protein